MIKAQEKYDRNNTVRVTIKLIKTTDGDIIKYLDKTPSKSGAFKKAIREKMKKEKGLLMIDHNGNEEYR